MVIEGDGHSVVQPRTHRFVGHPGSQRVSRPLCKDIGHKFRSSSGTLPSLSLRNLLVWRRAELRLQHANCVELACCAKTRQAQNS
jgi:hypothetical protein